MDTPAAWAAALAALLLGAGAVAGPQTGPGAAGASGPGSHSASGMGHEVGPASVPDSPTEPAALTASVSGAGAGAAGASQLARKPTGQVAGASTRPGATGTAVRPVPGPRLRGFDPPAQPWLVGHRGVDLAAEVGDVVVAAREGVVLFAGRVAGTPVVTIDHGDGLRSTYQPVEASVAQGQTVRAGEQIGRLTAGTHCPRGCLHLGARRGDAYLEPFSALGLLPVLLPLLPVTPLPPGTPVPRLPQ